MCCVSEQAKGVEKLNEHLKLARALAAPAIVGLESSVCVKALPPPKWRPEKRKPLGIYIQSMPPYPPLVASISFQPMVPPDCLYGG